MPPTRVELAIYHPAGELVRPGNPFGKDIANAALFRALALYGGFSRLHVLNQLNVSDEQLADSFCSAGIPRGSSLRLSSASLTDTASPAAAGALLRGQPYLADLAWIREAAAARQAYSLVGVVHTLAPPAVRERIATALTAPVQPWDALICTSEPVRDLLREQLEAWGQQLARRTGGSVPPLPRLPLIPLGVEVESIAVQAADGPARAALRERLGVAEDALLVLWVGRLSFFEKAFPQAMFQALQRVSEQGADMPQLHFAMAGWFPGGEPDQQAYVQAARQLAPDVTLHLLNGNNPDLLAQCWAASDVFLSLVDNIQETFGLAPVEAMAAGLPLVVSDWDGYRSTVDHGVHGFRIPTLATGANALGLWLADLHRLGAETYHTYAGAVAQHTAVHVGQAAEALALLARSPQLRQRMGRAAQQHARQRFAWPVVVGQIRDLLDDLQEEREQSGGLLPVASALVHPVAGDPCGDFERFASGCLTAETRLWSAAQGQPLHGRLAAVVLDRQYEGLRLPADQADRLVNRLMQAGDAGCTLAELESAFPQCEPARIATTITWLAKLGYVDWRPPLRVLD